MLSKSNTGPCWAGDFCITWIMSVRPSRRILLNKRAGTAATLRPYSLRTRLDRTGYPPVRWRRALGRGHCHQPEVGPVPLQGDFRRKIKHTPKINNK
eukprot:8493240-Pyramimonas_sp.AAC.1